MKLSIAMISEELKDYNIDCFFHQYDRILSIERYKFYSGDLILHSDTIYIFTNKKFEMLPLELLSIEEGTSLIFLDCQPEHSRLQKTAYICFSKNTILPEDLANRLSDIFERYRRLDYAMKETVYSNESMQKLVEIATVLFDNEITIRNSEYRFIAHSYKTLRYSGNNQPDEEGYTSVEEIQDLKTNPDYKENQNTQNVWLYHYKDYEMLCFDIFVHEIFICRIKLINVNHNFRSYDSALFSYFTDIVREKYLHMQDSDPNNADYMRKTLQSLLNPEEYVEEHDMQRLMQKLNFKIDDQYLMVCMQSGKNTGRISAYLYYSMILNKSFDSVYSFTYENRLAAFVRIGTDPQRKETLLKKLTEFLKDENFRAGISFPFCDLYKASIYYKQAVLALQLGMTYTPFLWTYHFKDYRYQYLYHTVSNEFPRGKYVIPELHELSDLDRNNNTEYMKTLSCYIRNNRNITQTAKELSIHRSTLLYRLEKISAITHSDIDNTDTLNLFSLFLKFAEIDKDYLQ
ncbi:MAG: helix-turn-helix domain-containing protein [Lachnospiraceae bacterium]|nr:helix-turn-helix domain-containing protein [Lachnospiraceae bacterium]